MDNTIQNKLAPIRTLNLSVTSPEELKENLKKYFIQTFDLFTSLFSALKTHDEFYKKPIPLRHPHIFYLGHTATFFVNKMLIARLIDKRLDQRLESICAVGVDEMSWDDLDDKNYNWPSVDEIYHYREKVRALVLDVIDKTPLKTPLNWENPFWAIIMGIEHENIHIETSSVLLRQHTFSSIKNLDQFKECQECGDAPKNELINVEGDTVTLGKKRDSKYYGWDNEYGHREAFVKSFKASKYLVSNQEYLEFINDGGYKNTKYWTHEGEGWLSFSKKELPEFWILKDGKYYLRTIFQEIPMPWNWPVEVNYLEAKAFCTWKSIKENKKIRLPSEDEWNLLHKRSKLDSHMPNETINANLHLDHYASPCPVNKFKHGDFYDIIGNVWQWSETPIYPFSGFEVHPYYDDFTTPTYDGKHNIILGGSFISLGNETELSSRYAFRRHFFQHAGFRYIESEEEVKIQNSFYEEDEILSEYLEFHYGEEYFNVKNYPKALVNLAKPYFTNTKRALDLGCAVGRSTFELSKYFKEVTGVDFSARFINLGEKLKAEGSLRYTIKDEGEIKFFKEINLNDLNLGKNPSIEFIQGDACNLKPQLNNYDFVLASNLIDRLYNPLKFIKDIHTRINKDGILLLASPYTWLEDHTEKQNWLGGYKKDGENYKTLDALKEHLSEHFSLISEPMDVPFVIRETSRKFQHTISEVTLWKRK